MATDSNLQCITLEAGQDLSAKQYYFIAHASDGQIDPVGTLGANADGVLQNAPSVAGQPATVGIFGVSKVVANAAITRGAQVSSASNGKATTALTTHRVLGIALEAAAADGDIISVLLKVNGAPNVP